MLARQADLTPRTPVADRVLRLRRDLVLLLHQLASCHS
jgi:hypothetical protein